MKQTIFTILVTFILLFVSVLYMSDTLPDFYESYDWEFLDKVVYINLKERNDRRQLVEKELLEKIPPEKILRFEAIRDSPGHIGCTKSHIAVLELAIRNRWKNVLIVEDDAMFHKYKKGYRTLKRLITNHPHFDVITLGNVGAHFDKETLRLSSGQTTTAYLVNSHYFQKLLDNFKEGLSNLLATKSMTSGDERLQHEQQYAIDQYWKRLQRTDQWYIVNPALMIQRADKSDIMGGTVDYTSYFNIK
jgi:glycosyl transferase family 25